MKKPGWIALMAAALLVAPPGVAQTVPAKPGVSFVSGGIGESALAELKAREKDFNLKLVLTLNEGNYLADVGVRVADAAGKTVIEHVTEGPIFLARLPRGAYSVAATYNGKTQTQKVTIGERLHTAYLRWPSEAGRDVTLPPGSREMGAAPATVDGTAPPRPAPTASVAPAASAAPAAPARGIKFVAGEVGEDAEARIRAAQQNYNLKLVFTLTEGNYLADVDVAIRDAAGKTLLEHRVPGPFLLAELPPGTYDVMASYEGKPRARKIKVGGRLTTEHFRWPSDPSADHTLPREAR